MTDQSDKEQTSPLDENENPDLLAPSRGDTFIIPGGSSRLRRMVADAHVEANLQFVNHPEVTLMVRGMSEHVDFKDRTSVTLGRSDHKSTIRPDVDLSRFGAAERGVSREHARLELRDNHLYIVDLGSTNGSFHKGERLNPEEPQMIRHAEEVILGRLAIQIMFI